MNAWSSLGYIVAHPLNRRRPLAAVWRWARWQIGTRLRPGPRVVPFVDGTRLVVERGMTGATGNVYCGLHEYADMAFTLHLLRPTDRFVDVGANIGSYAILAAGACGADVLAFEPVGATFDRLTRNIAANDLQTRVTALRLAVGEHEGRVRFLVDSDTTNRMADADDAASRTAEVDCVTLDYVVGEHTPQFIKIDVEGHESAVLRGARRLLIDTRLRALIVELSGTDNAQTLAMLADYGFHPYEYKPATRTLHRLDPAQAGGNGLMIRDIDWAAARVTGAPVYLIHATGSRL